MQDHIQAFGECEKLRCFQSNFQEKQLQSSVASYVERSSKDLTIGGSNGWSNGWSNVWSNMVQLPHRSHDKFWFFWNTRWLPRLVQFISI